MQIVINNPSLEEQLINKSKELKIKLDDLIEKLLFDKIEESNEFEIDEDDVLKTLENIKNGNHSNFKTLTPQELFDKIGI